MSDATTQPEALPPLPDPKTLSRGDEDGAVQLGYTADQMRAYATEHAARLHAECQALRAAFNAACAFIDCHVGDWDMTKEMVSKHAAFVKARAELAARAAKEQSK